MLSLLNEYGAVNSKVFDRLSSDTGAATARLSNAPARKGAVWRTQLVVPGRPRVVQKKPSKTNIGPDVRRCFNCGDDMVTRRYQRQVFRFVRCYKCVRCEQHLKHETRGFQGFYMVGLLVLASPVAAYALSDQPQPSKFVLLASLALLVASIPAAKNLIRSVKAPIVAHNWAILMPRGSGRSFPGRILGGDSRLAGAMLGVLTAVTICLVFCAAQILKHHL